MIMLLKINVEKLSLVLDFWTKKQVLQLFLHNKTKTSPVYPDTNQSYSLHVFDIRQ